MTALLQDSSSLGDSYPEQMDTTPPQGPAGGPNEGSKLPPVLAKLMDNLSSSSYRSPPAASAVSSAAAPPVNVQELLSSIMVKPHCHFLSCCCPQQAGSAAAALRSRARHSFGFR